jgi:gliding motility-associated-like protein
MKQIFLILLLAGGFISASAKHITGGEIIYDYLGPGASPNTKSYRITLRLFRDENCFACATMPASVIIGIFDNSTRQSFAFRSVTRTSSDELPLNALPPCITNPPTLVYTAGYYSFTIDLPDNSTGYTAAYQTCCRIDGIANIPNSVGATYTTVIPGTIILGTAGDNSPRFAQGISVVCYNKPFTLDFSATDPDRDVLVYRMCDAYNGGSVVNANPVNPSAPPYGSLGYTNGYSGSLPLGDRASINPQTGIISGIAPQAGKYVVSVCVQSYDSRTGAFKSEHRKDFIISVAPCDFAGAQLLPNYISCDGFTFTFNNLNTSPLNETFFWDFGDGNTSVEETPVHTYGAAGVYDLKLVINRGGSCSDSATSKLSVFPGYFPGITDNSPMCKGLPVQFNDATRANYGTVNYWRWDFGNPIVFNDTSRNQNPAYTYATPGSYDVTLIVGSDKGCIDTIVKKIDIIDRPVFFVSNDTLICSIDTLQLSSAGSSAGSVTWSPNYMINDLNTYTPLVSPDVTTIYKATYTDPYGCVAVDSVLVRVVNEVTLSAGNDTTICRTDQVTLQVTSDAMQYRWSPAATLNDPAVQDPVATPVAPTTVYRVTGQIGKCIKEEDIIVRTVPYPVANAGADSTICFGTSIQLQATGGSSYSWSPRTWLNNSFIANPVAQKPMEDTRYIVSVRDTLGCPKPSNDTVLVRVARIIADAGPADTNIVLGQPLQLTATGSVHYSWTPSTWLNNPTIFNPLSLPQDNTEYVVKVSNDQGCFDLDTIRVNVFKIDPDLLVPTAFSPDGDGLNDIFQPILVGMRSLDAFMVYNRWGQLVYSTTQTETGWDGTFGGAPQATATFVWYAEGTNYLGRKIKKKGTVILIR